MTEPITPEIRDGDFTERHVGNRSRLMGWSHRRRFQLARETLAPRAGCLLLDYGSGDATFLTMVADLFPERVGADIWERQLEMCREKFAHDAKLTFVNPEALGPEHDGRYGAVTCMEVLEHCPPDQLDFVIGNLERLVAPGGVLLISVPVETGLSLAVKYLVRWAASLRGIGPYREENELYNAREFLRMLFARQDTSIDRPQYWYGLLGHKGFNWRSLRNRLRNAFSIEEEFFSPVPQLRGLLNSQVWFLCRPRGSSPAPDS